MHISRIIVRNFRNFSYLEAPLSKAVTCVTGENNAGKSNFLFAIRLLLDAKLGSASRILGASDFHANTDISKPTQIVIAASLSEISGSVQKAFSGAAAIEGLGPTIAFRFRPGQLAREHFNSETGEFDGEPLTIEDYEPELAFCEDADPRTVEWHQPLGKSLRVSQLQEFAVEYLPALRDVEQDLRQVRTSPLEKLISIASIPTAERTAIENAFRSANDSLRNVPSIDQISKDMHTQFARLAGDVMELKVDVGVADPSFAKLTRTLSILFEGENVGTLDLGQNGLGVNNLLYISMISDYFSKRVATAKAPGQLFLVDEPEAHLHPQAQRVLYSALATSGFQTVLATHSTHVASQAPLTTHVNLIREPQSTSAAFPAALLPKQDASDIDRYLDATRSALIFARRVILVEGPAELFLIPPLLKEVLGIDLDRHFISVVPIYGKHFAPYAALFGENGFKKRCAIITDGDAQVVDDSEIMADFTPDPPLQDSKYIHIYQNRTTFERTLAIAGLRDVLIATFTELNHPRIVKRFTEAKKVSAEEFDATGEVNDFGKAILNAAILHGKARFAQVASKYAHLATDIPHFLKPAAAWLLEDEETTGAP